MERLLQYWDDLDDLYGAVGLISERIRSVLYGVLFLLAGLALHAGGIWLALTHPPLASATAILLFVALLYHLATSGHPLK
jgi:hypothetical protein